MAKSTASIYLKVVDNSGLTVEGECYDGEHMKEISLTAWEWQLKDPAVSQKDVKSQVGKRASNFEGGEAGSEVEPAIFSITKQTDKSTVRLLKAIDSGEIFPTATVMIQEEFKASPLPFMMKVILTDAFLVHLAWSASASGSGRDFSETWKLTYRRIMFSYLWRGSPPGWIDFEVDRKSTATEDSFQKLPLTDKQQKVDQERRMQDFYDAHSKKSGR